MIENDRVPSVQELRSMCRSIYDDKDFTEMEWHVMVTLGWVIRRATVHAFFQFAVSDASQDAEVEHMALYIVENALFYRDFVSMRPSVLARSALALARCILSRPQAPDWSGADELQTFFRLFYRLHEPSWILFCKYQSIELSGASATVNNSLRRPPQTNELPSLSPPVILDKPKSMVDVYKPQTPLSNTYDALATPNGYHTPYIASQGGWS
ncbi:hypothetical protein GQ44DRAFT_694298 [Phaeosphaeriaceae sp. PMI808]|nr:hypothetical protein GQ44DRAFT_694298 [Phaeosphaeriaceae sp. PMI808]